MLGVMPTEKIKGLIALASNSPGSPTGYGQQAEHLVRSLMEHGVKTAVLSNYGLEGAIDKIPTKHGDVLHYPQGCCTLFAGCVDNLVHSFQFSAPEPAGRDYDAL